MADEKWDVNANDAVKITLKHGGQDDKRNVSFKPAFTYPIYGDEETIYGYRGLQIKLDFQADTLQPSLDISWQQQMQPTGETKADDVEEPLKPFLSTLDSTSSQASTPFEPPGKLVHGYEVGGRKFGIWSGSLADPSIKQLIRNMQIFVIFFIEGGTCIELDDPDWTIQRWRVFFIYAIDPSPSNPNRSAYSLAGYSTAYRLFFLDPESEESSSKAARAEDQQMPSDPELLSHYPSRERISQFLILPPYQNSGHGSRLYETMMKTFLDIPTIKTITVEDPNESFDDMRDVNDLLRLRRSSDFATLTIDPAAKLDAAKAAPLPHAALLPQDAITKLRKTSKIAPRQFSRLLEMQLLARIPPLNRSLGRITRKDRASDPQDRAYYFWRLLVKERLYRHNVDTLAQLDLEERIDKLEETIGGVERDYLRILDLADRRAAKEAERVVVVAAREGNGVANGSTNGARAAAKRKIVDDEDDDDDDVASQPSKRSRIDDDDE